MYKDLSTGIKISITRSITGAFEQYMRKIQWDENKYRMENLMAEWRQYFMESSTWYEKLDDKIKAHPVFHEQLAAKINETIDKLLSDPPTEEQIEEIKKLEQATDKEIAVSCKMEAKYILENANN